MSGLDPRQFRHFVVRPTLKAIGLWSESAEELLLMTAAHESGGLRYLDQVTHRGDVTYGPAYGLYQIEAATHADVFENFLKYRPDLKEAVATFRAPAPEAVRQLITNLAYATAIARVIYFRDSHPLPAADDAEALAFYAKRVFNTERGAATPAKYLAAYRDLLSREIG